MSPQIHIQTATKGGNGKQRVKKGMKRETMNNGSMGRIGKGSKQSWLRKVRNFMLKRRRLKPSPAEHYENLELEEEDPNVVFLMETKLAYQEGERVRNRLGMNGAFWVPREGLSRGLGLLWKGIDVKICNFSKGHIDCMILDPDSSSNWRVTGFYVLAGVGGWCSSSVCRPFPIAVELGHWPLERFSLGIEMDICCHGRSCSWAGAEVWGCEDAAKETGKVLKAGYCSGAQWGCGLLRLITAGWSESSNPLLWNDKRRVLSTLMLKGAPLDMILSCSPKALALLWDLGVGLAYHSSSDGAWADRGNCSGAFSGFIGFVELCGWCKGAVFR
ncbi:hypothetical protein U1Q18_029777 [Sarracenia purpurea var. burkii]